MEQHLMDTLIFIDFILTDSRDWFQLPENSLIESNVHQLVELGYLIEKNGEYQITDAGYIQIVKERDKHVEND